MRNTKYKNCFFLRKTYYLFVIFYVFVLFMKRFLLNSDMVIVTSFDQLDKQEIKKILSIAINT